MTSCSTRCRLAPATLRWEDVRCGAAAPHTDEAAAPASGADHATCACGAAALAPAATAHGAHTASGACLPAEIVDLFSDASASSCTAATGGASSSSAAGASAAPAPATSAGAASAAPSADHHRHVRFSPAASASAASAAAAGTSAAAGSSFTSARKTLPRSMPWLDVSRMRKAPAAPDMDVLLQLDDGTGSTRTCNR